LNFGTLLLSLDRLKLQTLNFAGGIRLRKTKQKNFKNWAEKRHDLGHVTYFGILEPPIIS